MAGATVTDLCLKITALCGHSLSETPLSFLLHLHLRLHPHNSFIHTLLFFSLSLYYKSQKAKKLERERLTYRAIITFFFPSIFLSFSLLPALPARPSHNTHFSSFSPPSFLSTRHRSQVRKFPLTITPWNLICCRSVFSILTLDLFLSRVVIRSICWIFFVV